MPNPSSDYQDELFREFSEGIPSKKGRFGNVRESLLRSKMVSFEQILFASIGALIILVLVFSLGVERGRQMTKTCQIPEVRLVTPVLPKEEKVTAVNQSQQDGAPVSSQKEIAVAAQELPKTEIVQTKKETKGYTVQIVTYKDKKSAEKLQKEIHSKGQKTFLMPKGELMVLCIGEYTTSSEAGKATQLFRKQFPDCFVRKL